MKIKRGSTSVRRLIFIGDSTSIIGAGLTGLAYNSAGLTAYYFAGDLSNEVQITLATATLGSYTSGGFIEVDATNMPGWYEVGIPDAAMDGGNEVAIQYRGATNMVPVNIYIELDAVDYQSATTFGLSKFADIIEDTENIQSRLPAALVSGRIDASVGAMAANTLTASALASDATQEIGDAFLSHVITKGDPGSIERAFWQVTKAAASFDGTVQTSVSNTASSFLTDIAIDDFAGQVLVLVDGALAGEARAITSVVSGVVTVHDAFTGVPADGVNFLVLPQQVYSISQIQNGLATSSGVTSAFTEIKGAGWSSDTDTLVEIAAGGGAGGGTGSFTVTLTIKDNTGVVVPECDVSLTTSNTGSTSGLVAVGRTNANGVVSFQLDAGTYYGWRQKSGFRFTNPFTMVVADDGGVTIS